MKLRTQLTLAFVLLAVVPLAGIVLYSYGATQRAFRRAVEAETQAMTDALGGRMDDLRSEVERLAEELAQLPLSPLLGGETDTLAASAAPGQAYTRLVEGIGDAAELVEWFELSFENDAAPRDANRAGGADSLIIFPSEALAAALRRLERYRDLDAESAAAVRESMAVTLGQAVKRRSTLAPGELEALAASAERARRLLGTEFRSEVRVGDRVVGELYVRVRPSPVVRRVLSRAEREQSEVPYALDVEGNLYLADPGDRERLSELAITETDQGLPTLVPSRSGHWIVAESGDRAAGLVFGVARPIAGPLQDLRRTAVRNFAAGLGIVGLALLGVLWLSSRLTRNLGVLTAGAERLARGDWQVRVPVESRDELGQLAQTFNRMANELSVNQQRLLEEERLRKEQELQQRLLAAENQRKTLELEEARRFQLSLLPRSLPRLPWLELDVHMSTATEVGGDYYDFFSSGNGDLVAAVGDATGHGSRAGTMATVIKGMLSLGAGPDLPGFLGRANEAICAMRLQRMSMSLVLVRIGDQRDLCIAAAGMPPALLYRARSGEVDEIALEGAPLGGLARFEYRQWESELEPGDTLLLMSDGFPELLDEDDRPLGYPRARSVFGDLARRSPAEIIRGLSQAAVEWNGGLPPGDDMTFVVFKALAVPAREVALP